MDDFIRYITALRKEYGLSQKGFADRLNYSQSLISAVERGVKPPTSKLLGAIYTQFGVAIQSAFDPTTGEQIILIPPMPSAAQESPLMPLSLN